MNAIDTLLSRASSSRLAPPLPSGDALERVLRSITHAPDHGGLRPWRLLVISGDAPLARLADAGEASLQRREPGCGPEAVARTRDKLTRAPMVIVLGGRIVAGHRIPEEEQILSVGAAGMNLLNALHAFGFGAKWVTGAQCADGSFARDLGFDEGDRLFGLLMVGTPAARAPASVEDRPLADLVRRWEA